MVSVIARAALGLACGVLLAQPALKPGRKYSTVERLAPAHLEAVKAARAELLKQRQKPAETGIYQDFPAVLHVHAEDAPHTLGKRAGVLAAAKTTGTAIVQFSDHNGTKPETWRGLRDGVLFLSGAENGGAHELLFNGGGRFHSHPEGQLDAAPDGWDGMEIYNRHADAEDDTDFVAYLKQAVADPAKRQALAELFQKYPDEAFGAGCDYWPELFARWDKILATRPFAGLAANDSHQNQVFGPLTLDPYEVAFRNVRTHILARELSEKAVLEALRAGRSYVAHDWLAESGGTVFIAVNNLGVYQMGDSIPMMGTTRLVAQAPVPALWKIFHNGQVILEKKDRQVSIAGPGPGAYRAEAWLEIDGELRPWIYTNAIRLERPSGAAVSLPSQELDPGIEAKKDLIYRQGAPEDEAKHKLDVYAKTGASARPVLFFVHGGAWRQGDRSQYGFVGNLFAKAGYVVVVPSYRLAPKNPHPAQIEDVAAAFAWTVAHAAEFGGDPGRIYVAGHSAGGHLVALLATNPQWLKAQGLTSEKIRGVMALSGVYDVTPMPGPVFPNDPALLRGASAKFNISPGRPPFLITYCQWDYATLPQQAAEFHQALRAAGERSELVYVAGESHISEMTNTPKPRDATAAAMLRFMEAQR